MMYVRIELWPGGNRERARVLGEAHIANDGEQTLFADPSVGSYQAKLLKSPEYAKRSGVWKSCAVRNFPRTRLGPWDLLYRVLSATVAYRNRDAGNA